MTPKEWAECVLVLRSAYPHSFRLDDAGIDVWFELLCDLQGAAVQAAVVHMARSTKAFPSVAEIRQHATPSHGDYGAAWGELMDQIRREGYCGSPVFSDPLLPEVVKRLGGWQPLCEAMRVADEPTWRAQFRGIYQELAACTSRDETFAALGLLTDSAPTKSLPGEVA